jgi:uncharacterized membrane protein
MIVCRIGADLCSSVVVRCQSPASGFIRFMPRSPLIKNRLRLLWEFMTTSYWFLPALLFLGTLFLVVLVLWADQVDLAQTPWLDPILYNGSAESARSILAALSTSMITLTGTVFSLTIISLTLASGQFGPRLLRGFMRSTANQVVLGSFLCTFIYALLILSVVRSGDGEFVPRLSVSLALALAVGNAALLIFFIHHVARSIHANTVASVAASNLRSVVDKLIPEPDEDSEPRSSGRAEHQASSRHLSTNPWPGSNATGEVTPLAGLDRGYVHVIDEDHLLCLAEKNEWWIRLLVRAGDFVSEHHPWLELTTPRPLSEEEINELRAAFDIGSQRTIVQDFEAGMLELVEVAVRSLSPGINDPFTAIVCIDHLGAVLSDLARRPFPPAVLTDSQDEPRLWRDVTDFDGAMNTAFLQIRQAGGSHLAILIRLLEVMQRLHVIASGESRRKTIERHIRLIVEAGENKLPQPSDIEELRKCAAPLG